MGFRLQKRLKLFGGFGLNFSKSGISSSVRGPSASVGTKRYSIRTGIPGLTYVGGYSKKRKKHSSYSDPATNAKSLDPITSSIITIIATAIVLYPLYLLIDFIFPSFATIYKIIAFIVIGLEVLYFVFLIIGYFMEHTESTADMAHTDTFEFSNITERTEKGNNKVLNLDLSYAMTITNFCSEIEAIFIEFKNKYSIKNPFDKTISFPNATDDTFNTIPVFDICKAFDYLGIEINEEKKERDILLLCTGFFMIPKMEYDVLISDTAAIDKIKILSRDFICSINPLFPDQKFIGPSLLDKDIHLKTAYINKLKELLGVLTTIDFVLDKKENELLEILQGY